MSILVVEDSAGDAQLIRTALERAGVRAALHIVEDGVEAVRYLRGEGEYGDRRAFPFPTFIISDVKMLEMDGFQLLRWVRSYPACSAVPILFLSVSAMDADVKHAYELGANAYLVKPSTLVELTRLLKVTCEFWGSCACLKAPEGAGASQAQ
jgi:CheY-like chemotaxis protein